MPHDRERERKINDIEVQLARETRKSGIILAVVAVLSALALALLLAQLSGVLGLPDDR